MSIISSQLDRTIQWGLGDKLARALRKLSVERLADEPQGISESVPRIFYVDSGNSRAAATNDGLEPLNPFSTIQQAINACTANRGDYIMVAPGHTETVVAASGLTLNKAGVSIVGLGRGANRPTINFTTATTASMVVSAADCKMDNFLFTGGVDALVNPVHIQAADFELTNIETRDVTGQATDFIVTTAAADRLHIADWFHNGAAAAGADTAISIVGGDAIVIEDFRITGNFAVACIENVTTAATNIVIRGKSGPSLLQTVNAADVVVALAATTTGFVGPNINAQLKDNAANITEAFVGAAVVFFQPINIVNLAGESSMQTNITASTDI